jgi:hypothetical protein
LWLGDVRGFHYEVFLVGEHSFLEFFVKKLTTFAVVVFFSLSSVAHAQQACRAQQSKVTSTTRTYDNAVTQLSRLQERKDTRQTQLELRLVQYNADVETAQAGVREVEKDAMGDGFACLFQPRPNCIGNGFKNYFYRLGRAKRNLARAEARLAGYQRSSENQLARFDKQIETQQLFVLKKQDEKIAAEEALKVCLGG